MNLQNLTTNYTKIPNDILSLVIAGGLSKLEIRLMLFLYQEWATLSNRVKSSEISVKFSVSELSKELSLGKDRTRITSALKTLIDNKIIGRKRIGRSFSYTFNVYTKPIHDTYTKPIHHCIGKLYTYCIVNAYRQNVSEPINTGHLANPNKSLINNIKINTLIKPVIFYLNNKMMHCGAFVNEIKKWSHLQKMVGAEKLILGINHYSKKEMLDAIDSPVMAYEFVKNYIYENMHELDSQLSSLEFMALEKINHAVRRIHNNEELTNADRMAIAVCDGWDTETGQEAFVGQVQSGLLSGSMFQDHCIKLMHEKFKRVHSESIF